MCGIAGRLGHPLPDPASVAERLGAALAHRGPDGSGSVVLRPAEDSELLLVHRRLSILDLSELGRQPMTHEPTGSWIAYNGEIYNFASLRRELEACGEAFLSRSDTEVVLRGLVLEGEAFLARLAGMYALAFWDGRRRELLLAVDPSGIKPLYYSRTPDGVSFASELRALLAAGLAERRADPAAVEGYLAFGSVPGPRTILAGVRALPPGSRLRVRRDGTAKAPAAHWAPARQPEGAPPRRAAAPAGLRRLLEQVVEEHLVSDVPVGIFLSGGIDSGIVAALAAKRHAALRSFSVTFRESEFSEAAQSRALARAHGLDHRELELSAEDAAGALPRALEAMDQPTLDGVNVFVISEAVRREGIKVVLSGQGGDEIFAGYPTFRWAPRAARLAGATALLPQALRGSLAAGWRAAAGRLVEGKAAQFLERPTDLAGAVWLLRQVFPSSSRRRLFPAGPGGCGPEGLMTERASALREQCGALDPVNGVSWLELRGYLADMLLRDGDFMSMAHGLEVRVPFLDWRVVEWAFGVPGAWKVSASMPKPLLVRAAGADLPEAVWRRPKQGFTFPWPHWLRGRLRASSEEILRDRGVLAGVGLDPDAVWEHWKAFQVGSAGVSWSRAWALVSLAAWLRRHRLSS